MESDELHESYKAFQTPEGTIDLRKVLTLVDFPVYVLVNSSLNFRLRWAGAGAGLVTRATYFGLVSFFFDRPSSLDLVHRIRIDNYYRAEPSVPLLLPTLANILPRQFQPPVAWGDLLDTPLLDEDRRRRREAFLGQIIWEPYIASGLSFNMFHWDGHVSVSLAYGNTAKSEIVIAAVGVSQPDFRIILASLIPLHKDDDHLIGKFQEEQRTAIEG